ncbi:hypothetical protein Mal4_28530 [Maioricimonas rarisocia]|uniref:Uncharacterized protein n=1 Tax=Maioricimonas rarisocia TaxID=2528026 RepID=A0A517Z7T6_9PLAN|nr:hypothetical protein [Maioricimonas rarisocia]QDU38524.1 hypothetical protein Mal4_28530 [Maioricimonas rarisocia]
MTTAELTAATDALIAVAQDPDSEEAAGQEAARAFIEAARHAGVDASNAAILRLSRHFDIEHGGRAAFLALVCGALVEQGCDPDAMAAPMTRRLESLLKSAADLADACRERMPEPDNESDEEETDPQEVFEKTREELSATMQKEAAAWDALETFWRPAIAVYSKSDEARDAARPLRADALRLADWHEAGHWLQQILAVRTNEPILVIEPETQKGILGSITGVVDNFQLNTLIMDAFPRSGLLKLRRVPKRVADIARGDGPQQSNDTVQAVWNLYTWEAIDGQGRLPDLQDDNVSQHWIWNEGIPDDIPCLDGRRVILLGPPSYPRFWQAQRMFAHLRARLDVEHVMSKEEVADWLKVMATAKTG